MESVWKSSLWIGISTELHNDQEYYWLITYRAGAAVVSNFTGIRIAQSLRVMSRDLPPIFETLKDKHSIFKTVD